MRAVAALQHTLALTVLVSIAHAAACNLTLPALSLGSIGTPSGCQEGGLTVEGNPPNGTQIINLVGIFPITGEEEVDDAHFLLPAVALALDNINCNPDVLPGYHLQLSVLDSACDAAQGVHQLFNSVGYPCVPSSTSPPRLGVLGPGCGSVSQGLAGVAGGYLYLPQVSYTPALARQGEFTSLFKMVGTINQATEAALAVLDHFNWTSNIALLYQSTSLHTSTVEEFVTHHLNGSFEIKSAKLGYSATLTAYGEVTTHLKDPRFQQEDIDAFLRDVRQNNVRIIVTLLTEDLLFQLFCTAMEGPTPGDGFVWVVIGTLRDNWWRGNSVLPQCNLTMHDVESVINIPGQFVDSKSEVFLDLPNVTFGGLQKEYEQRLQNWCPNALSHRYFPITYDATWSLALAINDSLDALNNFSSPCGYQFRDTIVNQKIIEGLQNTNFLGASGRVEFNADRERSGRIAVLQFQGGRTRLVGVFNGSGVDFESPKTDIVWPGNSSSVPSDTHEDIIKSVHVWLIVISVVVTVVGIAYSISMFVFNCVYSKHRILRAASSNLNYVIIFGMWFGYASVLLLALLESDVGRRMGGEVFKFFCILRLWILSFSFTLSYGIMFARAWRIYRIFNDPFTKRRIFLKDWHLIALTGLLIVGDLLILIPWAATDPYRRIPIATEVDYEQYSRCRFFACASTNLVIWLGAVFVYKILIMVGGLFVVSLVRKGVVQRKIYDDSRSLSLAIYISAFCFIVGLPVQFIFQLSFRVVIAFIVNVIWVNISANATISCVFLPKFHAIIIKKSSGREVHTAKSVFLAQNPKAHVTETIDEGGHASVYHIYSREDLFSEVTL